MNNIPITILKYKLLVLLILNLTFERKLTVHMLYLMHVI